MKLRDIRRAVSAWVRIIDGYFAIKDVGIQLMPEMLVSPAPASLAEQQDPASHRLQADVRALSLNSPERTISFYWKPDGLLLARGTFTSPHRRIDEERAEMRALFGKPLAVVQREFGLPIVSA